MTHVHYKFSSKRSYNTVVFDGVNITLFELKRLIMTTEKLRATDSDLQITNAQTKEEYTDDDSQIPRGSSVIVRRVPSRAGKSSSGKSSSSAKISGRSESYNYSSGFFKPPKDAQKSTGVLPIFSQMADLATAEFSEDYKIKTIMSQSGYDSSNYLKYAAPLPANYTCYRCGSSDHHIRSCPVTVDKNAETPVKIKKSTGIPRSFMVKVDDPSIKGAMLTSTGDYAVHANDIEAYAVGKKKVPAQEQQTEDPPDTAIPDELQCLICRELLNDAVVIPCCGNSYCDDCIRSALLDSEDHVCPTCSQSDVSPDALIANKFLRQAVNNFTKEQICSQSFKSTPSTSRSQDCTPRPSPAPTPPPQSQPEKSQVADIHPVISSDSPPSSSSTSLNVVKVLNEIPEKEADLKKNSSPAASPSVLVPDADLCDTGPQPTPLVTTDTQAVVEDSKSGSTSQCDEAPLWDRSTSVSVSEGWTAISTHPPASSTSTFLLPHSPNITPSHFQTILQQQPLSSYPPGFSITAPLWPSGSSPQGTPIPAYTSSPIPPLLPKEFMLYHRRNTERTPPRGPSYNASCLYSSKSRRSKSPRSSSRSPSRSRSHDRTRHYSPYSSHRGPSSRSHSSRSYSHKRAHSPTTTSPPNSHSQVRSRSPVDRHRSRYHHSQSGSSSSSNKRMDREASERSYDPYLRWKQEYTDWCEKYFNSYFSHFHQMPPPPLMPPPQPHWSNHSSHPNRGRSPPSTDSRSYSERSSTTTHSSSSYSDSTPTLSFSDSNSPQSDDGGSGAPREPVGLTNRNKAKESGNQRVENRKVPPKRTDKHKSQVKDEKAKDRKLSAKEKERKWREEEEKRHKAAKASKKTAYTDRSRQPGRSKSPDSRSDKSKKRWDEETQRNQRQDIPIGSPSSSDLFPKALEREKTKKAVWKPQPLTKENAWEGGVKVKPQKKINININLDGRKNEDDNVEEAEKTIGVENHTNQVHVNKSEEPLTPDNGIKDIKNDSWEIFPDDETVAGGEDSDLWQCALTAVEEGEEQKSVGETEEDVKPQEEGDVSNSQRKHERTGTIIDDSCFKVGPSGSVVVCEEQQKTVVMVLEEIVEKRYLEKPSGHIKIPRSRRERDGFEKERQATVSSHHREGKGKAKRRLVEEENAEVDDSARLDGTVAPSSGRAVTDSGFDFDRKEKKKADRESQSRKGDEGKRHKERESHSTSNRKSSNSSGRAFTSVLDAEYKMHREPDEDTCREGKSRKINVELDVEWKGQSAYSRHYYQDGHQDAHLNWSTSLSQSDSRDRGQPPSKTFTDGQNWTCPAPPTSGPSQGTALDPDKTRGEDSKNERKKDRKKQKSHKKERRHASPDNEREMKKQTKDGGQMDLSKEYLSDKHT